MIAVAALLIELPLRVELLGGEDQPRVRLGQLDPLVAAGVDVDDQLAVDRDRAVVIFFFKESDHAGLPSAKLLGRVVQAKRAVVGPVVLDIGRFLGDDISPEDELVALD